MDAAKQAGYEKKSEIWNMQFDFDDVRFEIIFFGMSVYLIYERPEMPDKIKSVVKRTTFSNGTTRPSATHCE